MLILLWQRQEDYREFLAGLHSKSLFQTKHHTAQPSLFPAWYGGVVLLYFLELLPSGWGFSSKKVACFSKAQLLHFSILLLLGTQIENGHMLLQLAYRNQRAETEQVIRLTRQALLPPELSCFFLVFLHAWKY